MPLTPPGARVPARAPARRGHHRRRAAGSVQYRRLRARAHRSQRRRPGRPGRRHSPVRVAKRHIPHALSPRGRRERRLYADPPAGCDCRCSLPASATPMRPRARLTAQLRRARGFGLEPAMSRAPAHGVGRVCQSSHQIRWSPARGPARAVFRCRSAPVSRSRSWQPRWATRRRGAAGARDAPGRLEPTEKRDRPGGDRPG
jgi:hypothetical protein